MEKHMSKYAEVTPSILRELLDYDPNTGLFTWKARDIKWFSDKGGRYTARWCQKNFNNKHAGKQALTSISDHGYNTGGILGHVFSAHRVAWAHSFGRWPETELDHINRDRQDNRLQNLRLASKTENGHNRTPRGSSKYAGVSWYDPLQKWKAGVSKNGNFYYLGYFENEEEAARARDKKARELYGDRATLNFPTSC